MGQANQESISSQYTYNYTQSNQQINQYNDILEMNKLNQDIINQFDKIFGLDERILQQVYFNIDAQVEIAVDQLNIGTPLSNVLAQLSQLQIIHLRNRFYNKYYLQLKQQYKIRGTDDSLINEVVDTLNEGALFKDVIRQYNLTRDELKYIYVD
ncbi:Hypothetical_protein [Hexamita inflata]|uniref:Hypothetical_protein n=1 Tax=Hexamita inflata TaxID=28002 RepID=A0ABP1GGN9_9EUKA